AQLDLQGSFHASTADYLKLSDGGEFHAQNPNQDILTATPVESFGFLSTNPANISIENSQLNIADNADFSLTAGNISITNAQIKAFSGQIYLATIADSAELRNFIPTALQGNIDISQNALIETAESGRVSIYAGQFVIDDSAINSQRANGQIQINAETIRLQNGATMLSNSQNHTNGSDIILNASQSIHIVGENADNQASQILSYAGIDEQDSASSGRISLHAPEIKLEEGGAIRTDILGHGQAGDIELIADDAILITGTGSQQDGYPTAILSTTYSQQQNAAQGANLFIKAKTITISDDAELYSFTTGNGLGGNIELIATDMFMQDGFIVMGSAGVARAGAVNIHVDNLFKLWESSYVLNLSFNKGDAGDINITANNLLLHEASYLMSIARHIGDAGNLDIRVTETLDISGGDPLSDTGWASGIHSETTPTQAGLFGGDGGRIYIEAGQLNMSAGGNINTSSFSHLGLRAGHGGEINVQVQGAVNITGVNVYGKNGEGFGSGIYATSVGVGDNGNQGGNIRLQAQSLSLTDGGTITSSTDNYEASGTIDIAVRDTIHISGDASHISLKAPLSSQILYLEEYAYSQSNHPISGIYAHSEDNSEQAGIGGNIKLSATDLILQNKGLISTSSAGGGKAGNITLDVQRLQIDSNAHIISGSQFQNRYQFTDVVERDNSFVVQGDTVEVIDLGNGKSGYYVSIGEHLIQTRIPLNVLPNLEVLNQLSETYRLFEGQIVTVEDAGNGESAQFIYTRHRRVELDVWQRIDNSQAVTVLDDIQPIIAVRNDAGYAPEDTLPDYQLGERIRVLDMGEGKSADFIHTRIIDPDSNQIFVRFVRINQFDVDDTQALSTLSEHISFQDQNPVATIKAEHNTQYIYADGQWIAFNN
ncbi:MAG: hypothetical protein VSS52_010520, partial [Thiotrichaceae bacterium]|nr:hypothetical protein [Thiotrichaceae bacterium]